ncbi:MAG: RNA-binding protein [Mucilaginibacter sp.]|uniref:RNA recognition motif domain-containing protein n=1 Tax=Mucilaginibacter sp. TaxID=1882438 RepID=UPI003267774A
MAKLFIVGFPKDMEEIELVEIFSAHGTVNTVTIATDKDTGASKGYGFVTMNDDAGAQRAIKELDGASIDERKISVRIAEDKSNAVNSFKKKSDLQHEVPKKSVQEE